MDEINKIRKGYFQQGETINKLATKFNRSWNTIEKIVKTPRDELSTKQKRPKRKRRVKNVQRESGGL
jgi:transposase